jgi:hypothetical protein
MYWDYVELGDGVSSYQGAQVTSGFRADGDWHKRVIVGDEDADVAVIRIWQGTGRVEILDHNEPITEEVTQ